MAEPDSAPTYSARTAGIAVKVAVMLDPDPRDLGEWLADGAAFEAAGAEALWVDAPTEDATADDPLILLGALAVVTSRALLLTGQSGSSRSLSTVARLARGRLRTLTSSGHTFSDAALGDSARGNPAHGNPAHGEASDTAEPARWLIVADPANRAAWQATIADAVERGYSRVIVPANPRLLDILRNPDEPGDRRDLHLAMG